MKFADTTIKKYLYQPGAVFDIPEFQRPYSWQTAHAQEYIKDLEESVATGKGHYFGTVVYGNFYGVDAQSYINEMENGQNFIVCTVPSNDVVDEMSAIYSRERIKTVYVPTLQSVSMERMQRRDTKVDIARVAIDSALMQEKFNADYTLSLSDSLGVDKERFVNIIRRIIS